MDEAMGPTTPRWSPIRTRDVESNDQSGNTTPATKQSESQNEIEAITGDSVAWPAGHVAMDEILCSVAWPVGHVAMDEIPKIPSKTSKSKVYLSNTDATYACRGETRKREQVTPMGLTPGQDGAKHDRSEQEPERAGDEDLRTPKMEML